jgi:hypothetical protein
MRDEQQKSKSKMIDILFEETSLRQKMQLASSRLTDRDHCIHNEQNQRKISGRY